MHSNRPSTRLLAAGVTLAIAVASASGTVFDDIGYTDLVNRLGPGNVPNGLLIGVGQVELPAPGYGPDQANAQFVGKSFTAMSGPPGVSTHATTVASNCYGLTSSIAPGVEDIWLWETLNWIQGGYLKANLSAANPPAFPPGNLRIFNNSWIGTADPATDTLVLRRADYAIRRDETLMFNGVNNGASGSVPTLMASSFNGVAVGRADGQHSAGGTPAGIDGPGRMKPEIVSPSAATSYSTPIIAAAAAVLLDTAAIDPDLMLNPNADRSTVVKAALLAGANHRAGWSNDPVTSGPDRGIADQPLDPVYGADLVNINTSHLILTGGEHDGASSSARATPVADAGWDYADVPGNGSVWWTFTITEPAEQVSILATWHRVVASTFTFYTLSNFDLVLWRVDEAGALQSLVGNGGLNWFDAGNVVSQSTVDNVEHLYIEGLQPGVYALELDRLDANGGTIGAAVAWVLPEQPDASNPCDLNGDGAVDGADLGLLLSAWGESQSPADLNQDGIVDGADLGLLLACWG
ncbi:MAG: hypothetical protein KDA22_02920 [Phycisphaerales bacterium]|nr:hypothetical protein [Phycisphaerales bacterium]